MTMRRFVNSVASVNRILCVENKGVVVVLNDGSKGYTPGEVCAFEFSNHTKYAKVFGVDRSNSRDVALCFGRQFSEEGIREIQMVSNNR